MVSARALRVPIAVHWGSKGKVLEECFPAWPGLAVSEGWLGSIQHHLAAFRWLIVSDDQPPAATRHRAPGEGEIKLLWPAEFGNKWRGFLQPSLGHRCVNKCIYKKASKHSLQEKRIQRISASSHITQTQPSAHDDWGGQNIRISLYTYSALIWQISTISTTNSDV